MAASPPPAELAEVPSPYLLILQSVYRERLKALYCHAAEEPVTPHHETLFDQLAAARQEAERQTHPPPLLRLAAEWQLEEPEVRTLELLAAAEVHTDRDTASHTWNALRLLAGLSFDEMRIALGRESVLRRCGLVRRDGQDYRIMPEIARLAFQLPLEPEEQERIARSNLGFLLNGTAPTSPVTGHKSPITSQKVADQSDGPYVDDFDYLQQEAARLRLLVERYDTVIASEDDFDSGTVRSLRRQERLDEIDARLEELSDRCEHRIAATREVGAWLPRIEALAERLALSPFQRDVLLYLAAAHVDPGLRRRIGSITVDDLLALLGAEDIRTQVEGRAAFYRNAPLIREGIIEIDLYKNDLGRSDVLIDPRMLDHLLGLETEAMHLAGSHLYHPEVPLEDVVMSQSVKDQVVQSVEHFEAFRKVRGRLGLDERLPYGRGLVLLFHGPSGTGKTMLANAVARHIGARLMLVNAGPGFLESAERTLRFLIREARLQKAVLFFDESETFFREHNAELLTEIERHDAVIILATNRPHELHEAMHRRITLAVPFSKPDAELRRQIWHSLLPGSEFIAGDVDVQALAHRYPLTGGLIKNAVLTAVARAAARSESAPRISQSDLEEAARVQHETSLQAGQRVIGFA